MHVIGLTGNIATGKSLVAQMLRDLGAEVIDADHVAHALMAPGEPTYARVVERFGHGIVASDGTIDRPALGAIVFSDPAALADLDALVHPAVVDAIRERTSQSQSSVMVIEAIKLLESGLDALCTTVWVTLTPRDTQIERIVATRGLDEASAQLRVDAQPDPAAKIMRADIVIDNGGTIEATREQVALAWKRLGLGHKKRPSWGVVWGLLWLGMTASLPLAARNPSGVTPLQWVGLSAACGVLALALIWIIKGREPS